ncbi:MAG TPA: hypothetical protein VJ617_12595 [Arthrobacter sp.]|nr:hypothetical protein [Arthrobacter sp.]
MTTMDRFGAFSGAAYVLLANIGSALVGQGSNGAESPGQLILDEQHRIAENPWARVAFAVVVLAQLAFVMFVGYLYTRLRNAGWLAAVALVGGIAAIMASLVSMSMVITVFVLRDDISPDLARALVDVDGAGHLVQLLPLGVLVLFASAAALVTRALGRVLSWAGMAIGATSIVVLAATGLPANEDFFVWPFLLVVLWMAVISLRWGFARNHPKVRPAVSQANPVIS